MQVTQLVLNGLMAGSVFTLPAMGLTLIFSVLRFTNFAVASLMTVGAYAGLVANVTLGMPVYAALLPRSWWRDWSVGSATNSS